MTLALARGRSDTQRNLGDDPLELAVLRRLQAIDHPDVDPDGPDNITVSPYGGVIIAEDGDGRVHLLGAAPNGEVFLLARCEIDGEAEFCGPVFSADGSTLFANIQGPGYVFAVQGPFSQQP